ncbi:hypothetical protein X798_02810 [Onchocerca flexuosa]|uniref:Transposase n=2 Tax=Onchocerca flexuosa TaxID=387005 RepID=A0A183H7H8_9BILA|nr:hypothetical protein X798_02810 [Onchocerca flexuosa]VDO36502.1 unnamed protein product [Onchocerca flexuosa]
MNASLEGKNYNELRDVKADGTYYHWKRRTNVKISRHHCRLVVVVYIIDSLTMTAIVSLWGELIKRPLLNGTGR